jgi:hypothetical protein
MRSTAQWVGGEKRRFAPDAISDRIERTPARGILFRSLAAIDRAPAPSISQ